MDRKGLRPFRPVSRDDRMDRCALRPIAAGCFAIDLKVPLALHLSRPMEPTAILSFGVSKLPPKPASLAAHPAALGHSGTHQIMEEHKSGETDQL